MCQEVLDGIVQILLYLFFKHTLLEKPQLETDYHQGVRALVSLAWKAVSIVERAYIPWTVNRHNALGSYNLVPPLALA